jgi:PTS system nitrogen regulatory IIA component
MPHRSMNIREIAEYLHLAASDVETLVKEREIPCEKQGSRIMFRKAEIDAWASRRILTLSSKRLADYHSRSTSKVGEFTPSSALMPRLISIDRIQSELPSKTCASVIRDLVAMAEATNLLSDKAELLRMIEERETLCSTALPNGLAILHPRHHDPYLFSESFMILGRTIQPIHFGAEDGKPTDLFFLLCCQDDRLHLHTLARVCTMCMETRFLDDLRSADTASTMLKSILNAEEDVIRRL